MTGTQIEATESNRIGSGVRPSVVPFRTPARVREQVRHRSEVEATRRWLENHERGPFAVLMRRVARALSKRFSRMNAPAVYPWSPSRAGKDMVHELHRIAASLTRHRARSLIGRVRLALKSAAWLPLATLATLPALLRHGGCVQERFGQGRGEQWRDLLEAVWKHGIFPAEYYHHRVFRGSARADKTRYLNEREIAALLGAAGQGSDATRVDNLFRFISECRSIGLAVPRTYAAFSGGSCELFVGAEPDALPRKDLFFRPETWSERSAAQIWRWNPQTGRWNHRAESLGPAALIERCRVLSAGQPHVLQECLRNHPDVERFSAGGLCTVRIATGLNESGEPVPLFAALHLPACDAGGATTPAGELHAGIDVSTGSLLSAWGDFVSDGEFDSHPGTGAVIAGVMLPHWRSALELALRAHRNFRRVPFVGWEIGLSAGGTVLLEASSKWGVFHHALPADSAFPRLCLHHLAKIAGATTAGPDTVGPMDEQAVHERSAV